METSVPRINDEWSSSLCTGTPFNSYYRHFIYSCILLCGTIFKICCFIVCKSKKNYKTHQNSQTDQNFFLSIFWKTRKNTFIVLIMHYTNKKSLSYTGSHRAAEKKKILFVVINQEANPFS